MYGSSKVSIRLMFHFDYDWWSLMVCQPIYGHFMPKVRESYSLYVHIYIFSVFVSQEFVFPYWMRTILKPIWGCPWYNGNCRRKWTRWHEFKSWTRQIAIHMALISLGKVWIQLLSFQLWVNSRADWFL